MASLSWAALLGLALAGPGWNQEQGSHLADIGPAPEFRLIDAASGRPLGMSDLRGRAVLVSFIFTRCTGTCPATTLALTRIRRTMDRAGFGSDQVVFVSISLDPSHDTTAVLKDYASAYNIDPSGWHFLTGAPGEVARVIERWGMWARPGPSGSLDHPSRVFLVDPRGRQREIYNLSFLNPDAVLKDVRSLLEEGVP